MEYANYCDKVEKTAEWGGQVELQALTHALKTPIIVYSATQAPVTMEGDGFAGEPLRLAFHQHYYSMGEHYNSVAEA